MSDMRQCAKCGGLFTDNGNDCVPHECAGSPVPALPELVAELARARAKFPGTRFLLIALVEEVGELADALINGNYDAIRKEAIQVACVAVRIAEERDTVAYNRSLTAITIARLGDWCRAALQRRSRRTVLSPLDVNDDFIFDDIKDSEAKP